MSDNVKFQLPGPFGLPAAQSARAFPISGTVELRIRASVDGSLETLVIQMTRDIAREIAAELLDAAGKAEAK